jgi:hypothetical protein
MSDGARIEALEDTITQLTFEIDSMQNMMAVLVYKLGNPVIITEKDVRETPTGTFQVSPDAVTGSIMLTFAEETTLDSET